MQETERPERWAGQTEQGSNSSLNLTCADFDWGPNTAYTRCRERRNPQIKQVFWPGHWKKHVTWKFADTLRGLIKLPYWNLVAQWGTLRPGKQNVPVWTLSLVPGMSLRKTLGTSSLGAATWLSTAPPVEMSQMQRCVNLPMGINKVCMFLFQSNILL